MEGIRAAQAAVERARADLHAVVHQARIDGHTWAEIGQALGMSRQAAFKRFGQVTDPATGQTIQGATMSLTAIQTLTERVFDHIAAGDHAQLSALIHLQVREQLPEPVIADTWARVLAEIGAAESYSDTHVVLPAGERLSEDEQILGTVVGVTTINCEAGEVMGRVAVDPTGQVVGLLVVPHDHGPLPF